jgi:hypothetical protein
MTEQIDRERVVFHSGDVICVGYLYMTKPVALIQAWSQIAN